MKNLLLTTLLWRHGALTVLLAVSAACTSKESNGDDTGVNQDKGASHDTDASHDTGAPSESGDQATTSSYRTLAPATAARSPARPTLGSPALGQPWKATP
jgi:hypothetical protein